jgi:outer membrane protein assembly factor BamB
MAILNMGMTDHSQRESEKFSLVWRTMIDHPLMGSPTLIRVGNVVLATFGYGGRSASNGGLLVLNATSGAIVWRCEVGSGVEGGASVDGSRAFFGDQLGRIHGVDFSAQREIWQTQVEGAVVSAPLIAWGKLFVGTSVGLVVCLDLSNGHVIRNEKVQSQLVTSQPMHVVQDVRASVSDLTALHKLIATTFSSEELKTLCLYLAVDYDDLGGETRRDKARELVLLFFRRSELETLIGQCKRERPNVRWPGDPDPTNMLTHAPPVRQAARIAATLIGLASRDVLFGALDGGLYRFNAEQSGLPRIFDAGAALYAAPLVITGQSEIIVLANHQGGVIAMETSSGREVWRIAIGKPIRATPTIVNGVIYIGTHGRTLHAIDAIGGHELWKIPWQKSITTTLLVTDKCLVFGDTQGCVACLDEATQQVLWNFDAQANLPGLVGPASVFGGFVFHEGQVIFGSYNGCAYSIKM